MQTQVLGTVFDVKAYRKDAPKVTLMQGKVKVSNADTEVEMRPGQTATLQSDKIVVSRASSSVSDWLEGDFDMDQVTLAEAMSDIGAWYNKTVVFQSQANMDKLIHFRFSRRASLQEIITALNEMGVAKVRMERARSWCFKPWSCPFSYSISHIGITSILIPSRSKVSRWEKVMIFPVCSL